MAERSKQKGIMKATVATPVLIRRLGPTCLAQRKYRGQRARTQWISHATPVLISSYGVPFTFLEHITEELARLNRTCLPFDGELYYHDPDFTQQKHNSILNRSVNRHPDIDKIEYHIFDLAQDGPQWQRLQERDWELRGLPSSIPIKLARTELIQTPQWQEKCAQYLNEGYEGIILRHVQGKYSPLSIFDDAKRPDCILKFKPDQKDTYLIVGYKEGTGWAQGMLGGLIVVGMNDKVRFSVGTGAEFTKAKRIKYWSMREELIGKRLVVKHEPINTEKGIPICTSGYKILGLED